MPKAPILSRTALFDVLRDGTQVPLDYNIVGTSLGSMVEFRSNISMGPVTNRDPYEESITDRRQMSRDQIFTLLGVGGDCWPRTWNTQ